MFKYSKYVATLKKENYYEKAENVTDGFSDGRIVNVKYGWYVGGEKLQQQQQSQPIQPEPQWQLSQQQS